MLELKDIQLLMVKFLKPYEGQVLHPFVYLKMFTEAFGLFPLIINNNNISGEIRCHVKFRLFFFIHWITLPATL